MRTLVKPVKNFKGFTLVELLVALAVFSIVLVGLINVYKNLSDTYNAEDIKASMQQKARSGMDVMVRDMMMMGFGANTRILEARQSYVRFEEKKLDTATGNYRRYRIKYTLQGDSLVRQMTDMDTATPTALPNTVLMDNVASLTFEYFNEYNASLGNPTIGYNAFDPDWNDADPTTQSTTPGACQYNRDQVRRITIALVVNSDRPLPGSGDIRQITLKADISPRNLWETTDPGGGSAPKFGAYSTAQWLLVRDTNDCGKLKAKWQRSTSTYLAGYLVKYGTAPGSYTNYIDVPAIPGSTADPEAVITDIQVSHYTDSIPTSYYVNVQAYSTSYVYSPRMMSDVHDETFVNNTSFLITGDDTSNNIPKPAALSGVGIFNSYSTAANYDPLCPNGAIGLTWDQPSDPNVVGYRIYRSVDPITSFPPSQSLMIARETDEGGSWAGPVTDKGGTSGGSASSPSLTQAWGYTDGRFVDRGVNPDGSRTELQGCKIYYYAICPVTCDSTRIYGDVSHTDIYTSSQFVTVSGAPYESTRPSAPVIEAAPGWKRVFLKMTWPSDDDYVRTEVYFIGPGMSEYTLIPQYDESETWIDPDTGLPYTDQNDARGKFYKHGTYGNNMITFDSATNILLPGDLPELEEFGTYHFRAIAYDRCSNQSDVSAASATAEATLCGDQPCGAPLWVDGVTPKLWVDKSTTNLDSSTWYTSGATETQINIGFAWTDIDSGNIDSRSEDFREYVLSRGFYGENPYNPGPSEFSDSIDTEFTYHVVSTGHVEGEAYSYRLQAGDCVWANSEGGTGPDIECTDTEADPPVITTHTAAEAWGSRTDGTDGFNISHISSIENTLGLYLPNVRPGKFRQYNDGNTDIETYKEVAYTQGEFHNEVVFYLQNTSRAPLEVEKMAFAWGTSVDPESELDVKLGTITFANYSGTPDPAQSYPANAVAQQYVTLNRVIHEVADIAAGTPSDPIKVVLRFVNATDGTVDEFTDMRGAVIQWEVQFSNHSMPDSATSNPVTGPFVGGFTTGYIHDISDPADPTLITHQANPRTFKVSAGPSVNSVVQDRPDNPTVSVAVRENNLTDPTLPALPEVDGRAAVVVTANVTKPSTDTIQSVRLKVFESDPAAQNVSGATELDWIDMTSATGSDYRATIPGADDKGIWFYVYAASLQGQASVRMPEASDGYFYYKQLPFDVCTVNPSPPVNLRTSATFGAMSTVTVTFNWDAPTTYNNGVDIDPGDTLVYDLYRRTIDGTYAMPSVSGITGTTYTFTLTAADTTSYIYGVKARNSCATEDRVSGFSNEAIVCRSTGCTVQVTSSVYLDTDWTAGSESATPQVADLAVFICDRAGDHNWWTPNYGAGFDDTGDPADVSYSTLSDITMRVTNNTSGAYTDISLYEINDTGVFTMTGTNDTRIFIDPLHDGYNNYWTNTSPVPSSNITMRTFGATSISSLEDTVSFTTHADITNCAGVSGSINVATDPCANTPRGTTIRSGSRAANNHVTIIVDKVTENTDGSPASNTTDDVNYEVWYTNASAAARLLISTATDNGDGTITLDGDLAVAGGENNDPFDFYVIVTDSCTSPGPNKSVESTRETLIKGGSI